MLAVSAPRHPRSASRAGAVLALLLVALVHVLACAHGPTLTGEGRADTPLVAAIACGQTPHEQHRADTGPSTPTRHGGAHCWGGDEPTVQPPRDVTLAVPVVHDVLSVGHAVAPALSTRPGTTPPAPSGSSAGHARALFGVWRT
ncbi:hypothetical protein ABT121_24160 [Streptomyces sp. NPDC001928]|uniref:hypothetical protein n=1 Tax=Streptomyces sp. NPDC001928 TaxID=3154404 RepID=UPI003316E4FE